MSVDPFTREIVRDALRATAEEMFAVTTRTSTSPHIYDMLDFACALTDSRGRLIAQANGVTVFLGTIAAGVKGLVAKVPTATMRDGDIYAVNSVYEGGGTHLNDFTVMNPVFFDREVVAFAANKAHWLDIGGRDPGSLSTNTTQIYQEGIQVPYVRLVREGEHDSSVLDILFANTRLVETAKADFQAQLASVRIAAYRIVALYGKYGRAAMVESINSLFRYGRDLGRLAVADLPEGVYEANSLYDDDGITDEPIPLTAKVTISKGRVEADFTGCSPQVQGPFNCSRLTLESGVRILFLAITNPRVPVNEGVFEPLDIVCPDRTVFTALPPAPTSNYWEAMMAATDVVWKALAEAIPSRLAAGHFCTANSILLVLEGGGQPSIYLDVQGGGWGASADQDGESALVCLSDGVARMTSSEIVEQRYGIRVERAEFSTGGGGEGQFVGGRGLVRSLRVLAQRGTLTVTCGRHRFPPWGAAGGLDGKPNYVRVLHADGSSVKTGKLNAYPVVEGDLIEIESGTGGGWGDPRLRPRDRIAADLSVGLTTPERVAEAYGLAVSDLGPTRHTEPYLSSDLI